MDNSSNKSVIVNLIIAILILIAVIGSATYAYFSARENYEDGDLNVAAQTAQKSYVFTASADGPISYFVQSADMSQLNVDPINAAASDSANLSLHLAPPYDNQKATCTYDLIWTWKNESGYDIYTIPDVALPYNHTEDGVTTEYKYEFSVSIKDFLDETDLSTFTPDTNYSFILLDNETLESTSTSGVDRVYEISTKMYNLPVAQKVVFDTHFSAVITVDDVNCVLEDTTS